MVSVLMGVDRNWVTHRSLGNFWWTFSLTLKRLPETKQEAVEHIEEQEAYAMEENIRVDTIQYMSL